MVVLWWLTGDCRLGRVLRVRRPDVRGNARGGEEQDLASGEGVGEVEGVVGGGECVISLHLSTFPPFHLSRKQLAQYM